MSPKQRLTVSLDSETASAVHAAAAGGRAPSVSAWVSDAIRRKAEHERRMTALDDFLAAFEAEHGEITEADLVDASRTARARAVVVRGRRERPAR